MPTDQSKYIEVWGARVHNLRNIDARIPRRSLTVITGLSGSGKSSFAFDTLYAEGQRRYIETFSAYARNFLDHLERPDVDKITGLTPVISIEQKTTNKNPRSTVGTVTEIYDFLRLLYARVGTAYSYLSGKEMVKYTEEQIIDLILTHYEGKKVFLLAPLVNNRKGHYRDLFERIRKKGFLTVRIDGEIHEIKPGMMLNRYQTHTIEVVVDKLLVRAIDHERLVKSVAETMKQGEGLIAILNKDNNDIHFYSKTLMDPENGLSYKEPAPNTFSFNTTQGACPHCKGLGTVKIIDRKKVIPDTSISIYQGALEPLGKYRQTLIFYEIDSILRTYNCDLNTPVEKIPDEALDIIFTGSSERIHINEQTSDGNKDVYVEYNGLTDYIQQMADSDMTTASRRWAERFSCETSCPTCKGKRLNPESLSYRIDKKNISELANMDIQTLYKWLENLEERLDKRQQAIAHEILKEIRNRISFLLNVGLDYLTLMRSTVSLSGGESQRIRLATQIGSQLVNVLYILDEPSIGLHQRDNERLIQSLITLRNIGNTVVVVEHDEDMMRAADYIIDMGPKAGRLGGEVVFQGTPKEMLQTHTLTADYLNGKRLIDIPNKVREGTGEMLTLKGCKGNNLKNINVTFPLGKFICITGVSGSGKSTLINDTLHPILAHEYHRALRQPLPYDSIEGLEYIDKVIAVDQSPLGRTPRSNPATYTSVFNDIRNLFVSLPEAKIRGYKPGRFSFNVKGGRCETCRGNGYKTIEMNFLPNVYVPCETCHGKRYNRETLEIRYKGKSIADVLDMTVNMAVDFFENIPPILNKIKMLQEVGLGYIRLGQSSTTLSGGESQRVKLATELARPDTGNTLFILDEPTTGLHFEDIRILLEVLHKITDKGNTVIVIEHNLDIIKSADHIIDIGPEGGRNGGMIVAQGTPEEVANSGKGYTSKYLKQIINSTLSKSTNNK